MSQPTPPDANATQALAVEPRIRTYGSRRFVWALLALPLFALGVLLSVREISRIEETLAAEGAKAVRVVVYDLKRGEDLNVPIEPGTDVIRVVAHAGAKGALALTPHVAKITVTARGDKGTKTEKITLSAPGTRSRVTAEESGLELGDPVGFNVDVHGVGSGEMTLALDDIDGADGLLVRVYRREEIDRDEAQRRMRTIEEARREHLAAHAWELDWVDLGQDEQETILAARWRKIAAYRGTSRDVRAHAIALAPPPARPRHSHEDAFVTQAALAAGERASVFVTGATRLRVIAENPGAPLTATSHYDDGRVETARGKGEIAFDTHGACGVEVDAPATTVTIRAADAKLVDTPAHVLAWRTTPARSAIVTAGPTPLVLRVTARRPMPRAEGGANATITLDVALTGSNAPNTATTLHVDRPRSAFERYDGPNPPEAPTDKVTLHVLVPPGATATLTPREPEIDLTLAELDPAAPPMSAPARADKAPEPATRHVGDVEWGGFVARRPTNARAFEGDGRRVLRVPHRIVPYAPIDTGSPLARVPRARVPTRTSHGRTFEPAASSFEVKVGGAAIVPVRFLTSEPMDIVASVDDVQPRRRAAAVIERVTVPRRFSVDAGESIALLVLGDDLAPGRHMLSFVGAPGKELWVHAPWAAERRGQKTAAPRWISGDFEE